MNALKTIAVLVSAAGCAFAAEPNPRAVFAWRQEIEGGVESGGLYRVLVEPSVFDGCRAFPSDVRIIAADGHAWPFYVVTPSGRSGVENVTLRPLGDAEADSSGAVVQRFAVAADPDTGAMPAHNQLIVRTSGDEFTRRVEVSDSEDRSLWKPLGAGLLIDSSRASENRVEYPLSRAPFVQVRVLPDERNAADRPLIEGVFAARHAEVEGELDGVRLRPVEPAAADAKEGGQVFVFDTRARNLPVERLTIAAKDEEYSAEVKIYGRNDESNSWRWVADGTIQRSGESRRDVVAVKGFTFRQLKIELQARDGRALRGVTVHAEAAPRHLVFEAGEGVSPALYFGAAGMEPMQSNLRRRRGADEGAKAPLVRLGRRVSNQDEGAGLSSRTIWGIAIASFVVIASAVMIRRARRSRM